MKISLIAAVDEGGGIGYENDLPWHLRADLQRFKRLTMGHHLLMGRRTYQSIGKPLPGRVMIVLSRDPQYRPEGGLKAGSLEEGIQLAEDRGESELFVIGGAAVFAEIFPRADELHLTRVHTRAQADTWFPEFDPSRWLVAEEIHHQADEENQHPHTYRHLIRRGEQGKEES